LTSTKDKYPTRGKYGDATPVCEWCGKRVRLARSWRQYGTYCSAECQAADRPGYYRGLLVAACLAIIVSLAAIILGYSGVFNSSFTGIVEGMIVLVCSFFCLCYAGSMVNLGSKVIKQQEVTFSKDEIEKICTTILFEVQRNQTPEGVSRKLLYENLRASGHSNRAIKLGIEHLLVSEKLCQLDLSHYAVC